MDARERDPAFLIGEGHLEALEDFEYEGRRVLASRLGYRITAKFVRTFFGRVFDYPARVFDEEFLRPEKQDPAAFVDGVHNITEAQQRVARQYFEDGSIEDACPPLRALLAVMAEGTDEGMDERHPDFRRLFTREALMDSAWYRERLQAKRKADQRLWSAHLSYLEDAFARDGLSAPGLGGELVRRRALVQSELERVSAPDYGDALVGTLGLDPALAADD